ncbi:MAG: oligopeptide transport system substrate-binding protein [Candidatus Sumerlaeota bacterium]|nr:oligopeptide transport system substrate-binding protein [Candidatus Sumerlaeota bacterium]
MKNVSLLMVALAALLMAACSGGDQQPASPEQQATADGPKKSARTYPPAPPGVVRVNLGVDPPDLDPNLCTDIPGSWVLNHLFEPLVRLDAKAQPVPAQAESWEHNEDFTEWTFHLRKDNKWQNGDPVTAGDFVYSLRRILTPATTAQYAMMVYNFVEGGQEFYDSQGTDDSKLGISAPDDYTLKIKLSGSTPYFLSILNHSAWFPLHRPTIEKYGREWIRPENYVGNGPYRFKEYRPKDKIILEKADTFWDKDTVNFQTIEFRIIIDGATEMAAFISGDLDMTGQMPTREALRWRQEPEFVLGPALAVYYVAFNTAKPPFDDPALRRALALTINRDLIVEKITRRGEKPGTGFIPWGLTMPDGRDYREIAPAYYSDPFTERVAQAKQVLKDAGYSVDGSPGKPVPRPQYLYNTDDTHKDIAENMQAVWQSVLGAEVRLQNVEWTVLLSRARAKDFEAMRSSWFGDYLDPLTFLEIFETGHGKNNVGYSNPVYDDLLAKIRTESDPQKRVEYIVEAERLLVEEDCILAPVYFYVTPVLQRLDIQDVVRIPLGGLDLTRAYRAGGVSDPNNRK